MKYIAGAQHLIPQVVAVLLKRSKHASSTSAEGGWRSINFLSKNDATALLEAEAYVAVALKAFNRLACPVDYNLKLLVKCDKVR